MGEIDRVGNKRSTTPRMGEIDRVGNKRSKAMPGAVAERVRERGT
jgi:hypothetical protein